MALPSHINSRESGRFWSDNSVKVREKNRANTLDAAKTTVGTNATELNMPDSTKFGLVIMNVSSGTAWIGKDDSITAAGSNVFPLVQNVPVRLNLKSNSTLYGIVAADSADIYIGAEAIA